MGDAARVVLGPVLAAIVCASACAAGGRGGGGSLSGAVTIGEASSSETGAPASSETSSSASTDATGAPETSEGATTTADPTEGVDTDCEETAWYLDSDGDGRGDPLATTIACMPPPGYVPFGDDCDDADATRNPSAEEICDAIDNDCDALVDEATAANTSCNGCALFDIAGHSYALCAAGAAFDAARTTCASFGGDLVRLDDEAELAAVVALPEPPAGPGGGWLLGLSDTASEGTFVWIDGGGLDFTSWNAGEPNDAAGNEDCAEMDMAAGIWNDIPCADPRAFICESPAP